MIKFKERLKRVSKNLYIFTDRYGEDHEIQLERIPYTDNDCFVELYDLDIDDIEDPVIKMQIDSLDNQYEESPFDCADWDLLNDKMEEDD